MTSFPPRAACVASRGGGGIGKVAECDHIGALRDNASKGRGEIKAALVINSKLVDAAERLFDWKFEAAEVAVFGVAFEQRGIEHGAFAAAGGSADQEQPAGAGHELAPLLEHVVAEAELFEFQRAAIFVGDVEDELFAAARGDRGKAQRVRVVVNRDAQAAFLGDVGARHVQIRQRLEAGNQRRVHSARRTQSLNQPAVDSKADAQLGFAGLDVNLAGVLLDGGVNAIFDEPRDGRIDGLIRPRRSGGIEEAKGLSGDAGHAAIDNKFPLVGKIGLKNRADVGAVAATIWTVRPHAPLDFLDQE